NDVDRAGIHAGKCEHGSKLAHLRIETELFADCEFQDVGASLAGRPVRHSDDEVRSQTRSMRADQKGKCCRAPGDPSFPGHDNLLVRATSGRRLDRTHCRSKRCLPTRFEQVQWSTKPSIAMQLR